MAQLDFSTAPAGATHYNPSAQYSIWYKKKKGAWYFWFELAAGGGDWMESSQGQNKDLIIPRPKS